MSNSKTSDESSDHATKPVTQNLLIKGITIGPVTIQHKDLKIKYSNVKVLQLGTPYQMNQNSNIPIRKGNQFADEVVYQSVKGDFFTGSSDRSMKITHGFDPTAHALRTKACITKSGDEVKEITSDNFVSAIGQYGYETVFKALLTVPNNELKVQAMLALLTANFKDELQTKESKETSVLLNNINTQSEQNSTLKSVCLGNCKAKTIYIETENAKVNNSKLDCLVSQSCQTDESAFRDINMYRETRKRVTRRPHAAPYVVTDRHLNRTSKPNRSKPPVKAILEKAKNTTTMSKAKNDDIQSLKSVSCMNNASTIGSTIGNLSVLSMSTEHLKQLTDDILHDPVNITHHPESNANASDEAQEASDWNIDSAAASTCGDLDLTGNEGHLNHETLPTNRDSTTVGFSRIETNLNHPTLTINRNSTNICLSGIKTNLNQTITAVGNTTNLNLSGIKTNLNETITGVRDTTNLGLSGNKTNLNQTTLTTDVNNKPLPSQPSLSSQLEPYPAENADWYAIKMLDGSHVMVRVKPENHFHMVTPDILQCLNAEDKKKLILHQMYIDFKYALIADDDGNLPIHQAALANDVEWVRRQGIALKAQGETVDIPADGYLTPLQISLYKHTTDCCTTLLELGASPLLTDKEGRAILHLAAERSTDHMHDILHICKQRARKIMSAHKDAPWPEGWQSRTDDELAQVLMDHLCSMVDEQGYTPLMLASRIGSYTNVRLLVEASPSCVDYPMPSSGNTALYLAIAAACTDAAERGNKSQVTDNFSKTVETLLQNGASVNKENYGGVTVTALLQDFQNYALNLIVAKEMMKKNTNLTNGYESLIIVQDKDGRFHEYDSNKQKKDAVKGAPGKIISCNTSPIAEGGKQEPKQSLLRTISEPSTSQTTTNETIDAEDKINKTNLRKRSNNGQPIAIPEASGSKSQTAKHQPNIIAKKGGLPKTDKAKPIVLSNYRLVAPKTSTGITASSSAMTTKTILTSDTATGKTILIKTSSSATETVQSKPATKLTFPRIAPKPPQIAKTVSLLKNPMTSMPQTHKTFKLVQNSKLVDKPNVEISYINKDGVYVVQPIGGSTEKPNIIQQSVVPIKITGSSTEKPNIIQQSAVPIKITGSSTENRNIIQQSSVPIKIIGSSKETPNTIKQTAVPLKITGTSTVKPNILQQRVVRIKTTDCSPATPNKVQQSVVRIKTTDKTDGNVVQHDSETGQVSANNKRVVTITKYVNPKRVRKS